MSLRLWRVALSQMDTGEQWLAEETGRWAPVPHAQHTYPQCQGGLEDVQHALFLSPLVIASALLQCGVGAHRIRILEQDPVLAAAFVTECQCTHAAATAAALVEGGGGLPTLE
jgi:hypothetical protein